MIRHVLGAARMKRLLSAALLVLPTLCFADGADRICVQRERGQQSVEQQSVEWTEGGDLWSARVAIIDPRWKVGDLEWKSGGQTFRGKDVYFCEACLDDHVAVGEVWIDASSAGDPEAVLSAESLTRWLRRYLFGHTPPFGWSLTVKSDPVAVRIGRIEGLARAIVVQFPSGGRSEMIAVAATKGMPWSLCNSP
jgi:hypothetical protein